MLNSRKNYLFNAVGFCSNLQKFIELSNIFSHQVEHFYVTYFCKFEWHFWELWKQYMILRSNTSTILQKL